MKLIELKCPICKNFELKDHPENSTLSGIIFNYMLKCGHCGYSIDRQTHKDNLRKDLENARKMQ